MIEPVVVTEDDFRRFLTTSYASQTKSESAPARSAGRAATAQSAVAATIDLLQSDLIRELQLTAEAEPVAESKQDLMSASEDAPIIRLANSILGP